MSSTIRRAFGVPVAVLPVIHLADVAQGVSEALLAFQAGAPGVFLIDHQGRHGLTVQALEAATERLQAEGFADPWLGVNLLGLDPEDAFAFLHEHRVLDVRGVWCDGAPAHRVKHGGSDGVWSSLYFGGVAFKHQPVLADLDAEARAALDMGVDVLTTSGPATGVPCDPDKVRRLRSIVGPAGAVGVASGVQPSNVRALIEAGADALLVATGIAKGGDLYRMGDFYRMDAGKLAELLAEVQGAV